MQYVRTFADGRSFGRVVEFGSRNINGSVRPWIAAREYVGIDLLPGPDVDVVADARLYRGAPADVVICCEVLEHAPDVEGLLASAARNLVTSGKFVVTCATDPRAPHSALDGGPVRNEHYANIDVNELVERCLAHDLLTTDLVVARERGDLYLIAQRRRERS